jgi:hypothetical protein
MNNKIEIAKFCKLNKEALVTSEYPSVENLCLSSVFYKRKELNKILDIIQVPHKLVNRRILYRLMVRLQFPEVYNGF